MVVDLTKVLQPGTWRWLGQRAHGFGVHSIPIGGISRRAIVGHCAGDVYRIGRINSANAFVLDYPPFRLLYVRPKYAGYAYAARKVFPDTTWKIDYDHALGRKLAERYKLAFVLLLRIVPSVNRAHGRHERPPQHVGVSVAKVCFADDRIRDKWIGRGPGYCNAPARLMPYRPHHRARPGLTLVQAGKWAFAMGVVDSPLPIQGLTLIS